MSQHVEQFLAEMQRPGVSDMIRRINLALWPGDSSEEIDEDEAAQALVAALAVAAEIHARALGLPDDAATTRRLVKATASALGMAGVMLLMRQGAEKDQSPKGNP